MKFHTAILATAIIGLHGSNAFSFGQGLASQQPTKRAPTTEGLLDKPSDHPFADSESVSRRQLLGASFLGVVASASITSAGSANAADALQDRLDVESFLRTGVDPAGVMGVSGQAGKSRPETGVVLRDGTEVNQTPDGSVLAEILVGPTSDPTALLASFSAPWPLARGTVFDVECRDQKSGDGAFLAVTRSAKGKSIDELPWSFFAERLFDPTGRFSFYGPPTDIKLKSSNTKDNYRTIELSFSNLSQSTNAEIPRRVLLVATIVPGTDNAVCLVASANASRWSKGTEATARKVVESFRVTAAPKSNLKLRPKERPGSIDF